jgi:hypothetical protein
MLLSVFIGADHLTDCATTQIVEKTNKKNAKTFFNAVKLGYD